VNLRGRVGLALLFLLAGGPAPGTAAEDPGDRGGIVGDPISLDSPDPRSRDFLVKVQQRILGLWSYPCVTNSRALACEQPSAQLAVELGILESGQLQYVKVVRSSGYPIYDEYAVNAIRLASPYPAVPPGIVKAGGTGVWLRVQFNYSGAGSQHVPATGLPTASELTREAPSARQLPATPARTPSPSFILLSCLAMLLGCLAIARGIRAIVLRRRRARGTQPSAIHATQSERTGEAITGPIRLWDQPSFPAGTNAMAHAVLLSHGWQHDGGTATAHSYRHPEFQGHLVTVSPSGEWEHASVRGATARGSSPEQLGRHLGAIHGTASIADLLLPGRPGV
jgi:TonB family protein